MSATLTEAPTKITTETAITSPQPIETVTDAEETKPEATEVTPAEPAAEQADQAEEAKIERLEEESELVNTVYQTYRRYLDASKDQSAALRAVTKAQEAYDQAKEETAARKTVLDDLLGTFPDRLLAIRDPGAQAIIVSVQEAVAEQKQFEAASGTEEATAVDMMDYDAWRALSTQIVIDMKIPGLGTKKADKLLEQFPTFGTLDDARTEASTAHMHFCKKLPKGFGEPTADAIFDAMQSVLMGGWKKLAKTAEPSQETSEPAPAPAAEPTPEPTAAAEPEPAAVAAPEAVAEEPAETASSDLTLEVEDSQIGEEDDEPAIYSDDDGLDDDGLDDNDEWEDMDDDFDSDEEDSELGEAEWAVECLKRLLEDPEESSNQWGLNDIDNTEEWKKGKAAYGQWEVDACPFDETSHPEQAMQWVRGWCAASMDLGL